jgi:hypothetical protein
MFLAKPMSVILRLNYKTIIYIYIDTDKLLDLVTHEVLSSRPYLTTIISLKSKLIPKYINKKNFA